jgi:hypothetical protein
MRVLAVLTSRKRLHLKFKLVRKYYQFKPCKEALCD